MKQQAKHMARQQVDWFFCQVNSDRILAEGIFALRHRPVQRHSQVSSECHGNYLISLNGDLCYIGEAKSVSARIKQQYREKTSTFYKTLVGSERLTCPSIGEFGVQCIETNIGRKEVEEFGIVNLPTTLNKFQLGKRAMVAPANTCALWTDIQIRNEELLIEGENALLAQGNVPWTSASVPRCAGVYAVQDGRSGEVIYIGESSDIGKRYETHNGITYFSALRRHVGTEILDLELKTIRGKARYFTDGEDSNVTAFLHASQFAFLPVSFGRYELEESLIKKHCPLLNRKGKSAAD
jgi:predicted GIY-YIG superfamily endonuclease